MRRLNISIIYIICIICGITSFIVSCQKSDDSIYTITEPYEYPVVPAMDEWGELKSLRAKADACQIPEDILKNMTTKALVESVINYPLAINICAYADLGAGHMEGLKNVSEYFNGLPELYSRPDAIEELDKFTSREEFINNANPLERIFTKTLRRKLEILNEEE